MKKYIELFSKFFFLFILCELTMTLSCIQYKLSVEDHERPEMKISQIPILTLILTCLLLFCKSPTRSEFLRPLADLIPENAGPGFHVFYLIELFQKRQAL